MGVLHLARRRVEGWTAPLFARIEAVLDGMSTRDRRLGVGLLLGVLAVLLVLATRFGLGIVARQEQALAAREEALAWIEQQWEVYQDLAEQEEDIQKRMAAHATTDLSAFLEEAATKAQIDRLDAVRPSPGKVEGIIEHRNYSVSLSKVTLEQLASFLYEVETSGYPLRISSVNIKAVRTRDGRLLNVKMDITAFRVVEDAEGSG